MSQKLQAILKRNIKYRGVSETKRKNRLRGTRKLKVGGQEQKDGRIHGGEEREREIAETAEDTLKKLEAENQLLADQLMKASALIRELENRFYEASRKQNAGKAMAAGLLHDLRNPLAVINSCAQFCLEGNGVDSPAKEKLQMIVGSVKRASDLTNKFLDYAKVSVLDYKPVNINRTLLVIWKMSELQSAPCHVSFEAHLGENLPEIMGNQDNLERVFLNLFMNAIHAVSKKGKIVVQTSLLPSRDIVEIKIGDDGPGIPKEQQERLFQPFYTTKEDGTGLGLNICQSLILQHKGSISINSENGRGTTVIIKLPIQQDGQVSSIDKATPFE